jgi:hypothetical protein
MWPPGGVDVGRCRAADAWPKGFREHIPAPVPWGSGLILTYSIGISPGAATGEVAFGGDLVIGVELVTDRW